MVQVVEFLPFVRQGVHCNTLQYNTINFLHAIFFWTYKYVWHDTGSVNPSSFRTKTRLFYIVSIMGADVQATQGARASTAMTLN